MKSGLILIGLLFLAFSLPAKKLYKYQDEQGVWHFSDTPPETDLNVEVRQLKPLTKQRVWLEKTGSETSPEFFIRNSYRGPVEVEVEFTRAENAVSTPELPKRFVVPPGESDSLFSISGVDAFEPWSFTLQYRYIVGSPEGRHDPSTVYQPPFAADSAFQISQAFNGPFSHEDAQNKYAVDIVMPIGTPVHAARSGRVMEVEDDYFIGGTENPAYQAMANSVRILHDDGSMAVYAHLELEKAQVYPGDRVAAGQLIAFSGSTGYTTGPHLHFAVQVNKGMQLVSVPFRFVDEQGKLQEPISGQWLRRP